MAKLGLISGAIMVPQAALASSILAESTIAVTGAADASGFVQSFLLILLSEIGDKTFFIAALLAAKYGRLISFTGATLHV